MFVFARGCAFCITLVVFTIMRRVACYMCKVTGWKHVPKGKRGAGEIDQVVEHV